MTAPSMDDMVARFKQAEESKHEPVSVLLMILLLTPSLWWTSWCVATVWGWYCASFSLPAITWHQVVGPLVIRAMVFGTYKKDSTPATDMVTGQLVAAIACAIGLLLAYILRP